MQTSKLYLLICLAAEMTSAQNEKQTSYTSEETELFTDPILTVSPNETVWEGDDVTLNCESENKQQQKNQLTYTFYRENTPQGQGIAQNNKIHSIQHSHAGMYFCEAEAKERKAGKKKSNRVQVTVNGRTAKLEMKAERTDGQIFEGDQVSLQCQVTGNPVGWTYELYEPKYIKIYETKAESTFTISSASLLHRGEYWCRAVKGNLYSLESNRVTLQVSESPVATLTPSNTHMYIGDKLNLDCKIDGSFTGWEYQWYKRDKKATDKHFETSSENTYTFEAVTESDSGEYLCSAYKADSPHSSKKSSAVTVTVEGRTAKLEMKAEHTDGQIFEGDQVSLQCQVTGNPVGWTYELYKSKYIKIYETKEESTFTISSASLSYKGEYWCRAVKGNLYSLESNRVTLQVSGRTAKLQMKAERKDGKIFEGDQVSLQCQVTGNPVGWTYELYTNKNQYKKNAESTFTISSVILSHRGEYWCKAVNGKLYSVQSNRVKLQVSERPKVTVKLTNEKKPVYIGDTVTLKCSTESGFTDWNYYLWYKGDQTYRGNQIYGANGQIYTLSLVTDSDRGVYRCSAQSGVSPRYSQISSPFTLAVKERTAKLALNSKQIFEGDQVILYCQVDGDPAGWKYEFWWNGSEQPYKSDMKSNFIISPVNVLHSGVYKCRAGKEGLYSKYSNDVQLQVSERTAKLTLNLKLIFEGDQVILYCQVDGDPAGWKYELCRNGCGKPYKSDVESTFTISPVNVSHSGVYKCRAGKGGIYSKYSNDVQLQVSGIWVTLSASPSSYVKIGNSLNLICTHSGNKIFHSTLTFIFLRNNETIKSSSDSKVLTINQFNESHTGSYKCGVESAGGGKTYSNEIEIKVQEIRLPVILVAGGLGLFLLILLPFLIVYHRTRGLPCSGSKSARTHKKVADTNTPIGGAVQMDTLNTGEVLYSELVNPPKGKKKGDSATKADSGVVYSDLIIGKLKKRKPGKEPTGTQEVLYSDIKLKNVTGDSAAESGDPVYSNIVIEKSVEKKKKKKDAPPADDPGALYASVLPKKGKK
ncbi:titin-like isoform X3 [Polypterus senegalus]|uniref:titin-like isoform X3 n=1 Tax=Polypterus senegalus TaxID=55291 RepID=UPI00196360CC|nr:titin-like isoform X3 [Polypterus senegalus]